MTSDEIWTALRAMKDPARGRDIVALGVVRDVRFDAGVATVGLAEPSADPHVDEAIEHAIRREVGAIDGVKKVNIGRASASGAPADDVHLRVLGADGADGSNTEVDFSDWGPTDSPDPDVDIPQDRYVGRPPVFQWEIDPSDPTIESGEREVVLDEWEYSVWWQRHPTGLVYGSIQALHEDMAGAGREHPIGRNIAVNLVYDQRREGVIAIYGTAGDFRPFVRAFCVAFGIETDGTETDG